MAGIKFSRLSADFIVQLERLGAEVVAETNGAERPVQLLISQPGRPRRYFVFLWTVTPGGGGPNVRPANERRIQLTTVQGLRQGARGRIVLGGWSEEFGVYAFWDARRHVRFSQKSPSLQVGASTLEEASGIGIATQVRPSREGIEVVVAVHPDSLLWYVQQGEPLHDTEEVATGVAELIDPTPEDEDAILNADDTPDGAVRRRRLVETMQLYREGRFRPDVLRAYGYRCAVCGYSLKLVDSAHIIPVADPRSNDHVTNGLALCKLHHAAFDTALIGVKSDYSIILNFERITNLTTLGRIDGLEDFMNRLDLPRTITPPKVIEVRPNRDYLIIGLQARRWPQSLIG